MASKKTEYMAKLAIKARADMDALSRELNRARQPSTGRARGKVAHYCVGTDGTMVPGMPAEWTEIGFENVFDLETVDTCPDPLDSQRVVDAPQSVTLYGDGRARTITIKLEDPRKTPSLDEIADTVIHDEDSETWNDDEDEVDFDALAEENERHRLDLEEGWPDERALEPIDYEVYYASEVERYAAHLQQVADAGPRKGTREALRLAPEFDDRRARQPCDKGRERRWWRSYQLRRVGEHTELIDLAGGLPDVEGLMGEEDEAAA